jgi:hypothetical protein
MSDPTIRVPVKFVPDPTIGNALLDVSSLDPAGATDGQVVQRIAGVWAPGPAPTSSLTRVKNVAGGTIAAASGTRTIHAATAAVVYQLEASPADKAPVEIQRDLAGTGAISFDGNGHNIVTATGSSATWGPSTTLAFAALQFDAVDGVWRA